MRNDLLANDDEIYVEEDEDDDDDDGELDEVSLNSGDIPNRPTLQTWPTVIGIVQICIGFITAILGTMEIFVVPLMQFPDEAEKLHLGKDNCFGLGLVAGFFMVLTGSLAVRASISKRPTSFNEMRSIPKKWQYCSFAYLVFTGQFILTAFVMYMSCPKVRKFFSLTLFTLVLYTFITVVLIMGYSLHWTSKDKYKEGSLLYEMHIFVTITTILGFMFDIAAFVQYYEVVFFGQYQLCQRWTLCLCPCVLKMKKKTPEMSSNSSLPI